MNNENGFSKMKPTDNNTRLSGLRFKPQSNSVKSGSFLEKSSNCIIQIFKSGFTACLFLLVFLFSQSVSAGDGDGEFTVTPATASSGATSAPNVAKSTTTPRAPRPRRGSAIIAGRRK